MPQYSDIPEGFEVATATPRYSDIPEGFSVQQQPVQPPPRTRTEALMRDPYMKRFIESGRALGRQGELVGRAIVEGAALAAEPFTEPVRYFMNKHPGINAQPLHQATAQTLSNVGIAEPENELEQDVLGAGRFVASVGAGTGISNLATKALGIPLSTMSAPKAPSTQAGRTLADKGVPLDASQRSGGRFANMLRTTIARHPATIERAEQFSVTQRKGFNRAVLRTIGADADEATRPVMSAARTRIGGMFDRVGRQGANFDDRLQSQIVELIDDAKATIPESELGPLMKNIDDLLNAVDDAGHINGQQFIKIRSRLGRLSRNQQVGQSARDLENAMLDTLERSHPGQRALLRTARDQYSNLKAIEPAIAKDTTGNISPRILSNQFGTIRGRSRGVYGRGEQGLVDLAKSGREVLPEILPTSGTAERSLMHAPFRALTTAGPYRAAQNYLLRQPGPTIQNSLARRSAVIPGGGTLAQILDEAASP